MKPAQRVRPAAATAPAAAPPAVVQPGPLAEIPVPLGQGCYRCHLHLTAKHRPREVSVWGLANRPMKVVMCSACATAARAVH